MGKRLATALLILFAAVSGVAEEARRPAAEWIRDGAMWDSGAYVYDAAGNITNIGNDAYSYDQSGRLLAGTAHTPSHTNSQSFVHDRYGNLTSVTQNAAGTTALRAIAVVRATNQLDGGDYDASGNQRTMAGTSLRYEWDALNMMSDLRDGTTRVEHYVYDAGDERIAVVRAQEERYSVRGLDKKVARDYVRDSATGAWSIESDYVHRGKTLAAAFRADGVRHFHVDHAGTPRLVTDASGYKLALRTYWPFGSEVPESEWLPERLQFTGHERDFSGDPVREVDYMHARYYAPGRGRFFSVDRARGTAAAPQSWNRYSYALNSPLRFVDPDGNRPAVVYGRVLNVEPGYVVVLRNPSSRYPNHVVVIAGFNTRADGSLSATVAEHVPREGRQSREGRMLPDTQPHKLQITDSNSPAAGAGIWNAKNTDVHSVVENRMQSGAFHTEAAVQAAVDGVNGEGGLQYSDINPGEFGAKTDCAGAVNQLTQRLDGTASGLWFYQTFDWADEGTPVPDGEEEKK